MSVYLDYNASTPIDDRVLDVMITSYREYYGNADSRTHDFGQKARQQVENARKQIASLLNVQSNEIVFTSGATESNNIAVLGLQEFGLANNRRHIITTAIEHKAVLEAANHLESKGFEIEVVKPNEDGRIDKEYLLSRVRADTVLVSVQHVNNETGIIQPVKEIGDALRETDTMFHIDAVQSCGKLVNEIRELQYDLLSISAHKMYGPQGIGALVLRRSKKNKRPPIQPITSGGGQEGGLRPGTLPAALIIGFGKACEIAEIEYKENLAKYKQNKQNVVNEIEKAGVGFVFNGDQRFCIDNTLNVSFPGIDSEALMISTKQYCSISNGSACTSRDYSSSYVLLAMGLPLYRTDSAVRLSWGADSIDINQLRQLLMKVRDQQ